MTSLTVYDYLISKGYTWVKKGHIYFTNSPFNPKDRTPSMALMPSGVFKDYSTGKSGNVYTLLRHFGDKNVTINNTWVPPPPKITKPWRGIPDRYLNISQEETDRVIAYANSRRITDRFLCGATFFMKEGSYHQSPPAIIFPHVDENSVITGAKFRYIEGSNRFTCRGVLGFYILENIIDSFEQSAFYLVESESSANSLWSYFKDINKPCVVASAGSVTSIPKKIPKKFNNLTGYLIIDFDGSEEKYKERLKLFEHLELSPIRLVLPKGEDINSLYIKNQIQWIETIV